MVATSADAGWTTWPLHNSYPPIMQQMILQAAAGRLAERNIRVGQPYDQSFAAAGASATATVIDPQGTTGRGQAQEQRRGQPASFRADRAFGAVPGADRPSPDARDRVRRQPRPRRERPGQARSHGGWPSACPAGTSFT